MITFNDGEVSVAQFFTASGGFVEQKLDGTMMVIDDSTFVVISGDNAQEVFQVTDNVLSGLDYSTASGITEIDDIANVSGLVSDTVGDLNVVCFPTGDDSTAGFQLTVAAQPVSPVHVRMLCAVKGTGTGDAQFLAEYNLFNQNTSPDLNPGSFTFNKSQTLTINAAAENDLQVVNFTIPVAEFSSGSAPFIASFHITRSGSDASDTLAEDVAIVTLYIDNLPGGAQGNTAGYIGGNLDVTGNLAVTGDTTLSGALILENSGTIPPTINSTGTSGTLIFGEDYGYFAVGLDSWKRFPLSQW